MAIIHPRMTYDHLLQLPEDGKRYELVDGDLLVSPSPIPRHQNAVGNVYATLRAIGRRGHGRAFVAPLDVVFDEYNVAQPDVIFVSSQRLHIVTYTNIQGAPDLVVEVLSDGTRQRDLGVKLHMYARFKVPHYWVVDPAEQCLQRYEYQGEGYAQLASLHVGDTFTCSLFPDVELSAAELFE